MSDTSSIAIFTPVATTGGITLFGIATGLQPELLIAGSIGGWWALSYQKTYSAFNRINRIFISALTATWLSPTIVHIVSEKFVYLPPIAALPIALGIGLVTIDALGSGLTVGLKRFLVGKRKEDL